MPSLPRLSSTHWAETSVVSQNMGTAFQLERSVGGGRAGRGAAARANGDALEQEVDLAAQAEAEDGVQEGGDQREAGGHQTDGRAAEGEPEEPDRGEAEPD